MAEDLPDPKRRISTLRASGQQTIAGPSHKLFIIELQRDIEQTCSTIFYPHLRGTVLNQRP